jgi:hypothetical protein
MKLYKRFLCNVEKAVETPMKLYNVLCNVGKKKEKSC